MTEKKERPTIEQLEKEGRSPWKPATATDYLDDPGLYAEVRGFFTRYLDMQDPRYYDVLAAWTLHTWIIEQWRATGPLCIIGPISSGKTTILECLEELSRRGIRGGSMSNATMFRLSDAFSPTLLIDESQIYNRDEWAEVQAFINERYRKGGRVWRVDQDYIPQSFKAYGATALAQSEPPWEALISRAIILKMEKGRPREQTLTEDFENRGTELRNRLAMFRTRWGRAETPETELDRVVARLEQAKTREEKIAIVTNPYPAVDLSELKDYRIREIGYPLLMVAPDTGPREEIVSYLKDLEKQHDAEENTGYLSDYVIALTKCVPDNGKVSIAAVRVQWADLHGEYDPVKGVIRNPKTVPRSKTVAAALRTLGFAPTRMSHGPSGIQCDASLLKRLCDRYRLESTSLPSPPSPTNAKTGEASEAGEANPKGPVGDCSLCRQHAPLQPAPGQPFLVCRDCYREKCPQPT